MNDVVQKYYEHLTQPYMDALYPLTVRAITTDTPEVAKMAVEFWSTLAETETNVMNEGDGYCFK